MDGATLRRIAALAVPALAAAYAVAAVALPHNAVRLPLTTYADVSTGARTADVAAGLALLAAGVLAWWEPRTRRLGLLAMLAGAAWFGPDWEGWKSGPSLVRSLGAVAPPIFAALVFHLVVAFPTGRVRGRLPRVAIVLVYAVAVSVSVGAALFRDPLLDLHCWRDCLDNALLVHAHQGLTDVLRDVWLRSVIAVGALLAAIAVRRLVAVRRPARPTLWPVLVPGAIVGAAEATYGVALLHNPFEDPELRLFSAVFYARALSVTLLAVGLASGVLRARRARAIVSQLAKDVGAAPPPGRLRDALAAAVGDPTLDVAYWLPEARRFVDGAGRPTEPPGSDGRRGVTPIVRGGQPVAVVAHDPALVDARDFEREIGSAARLALENERLQAELLAQLNDLQISRARIVETGDAERRRLERDLHDGAQQRLLALSYDVRLARAAADADGDAELAALLAHAGEEAHTALTELRELAQGIYPAILAEAGLTPALETLADEAPIPVELGGIAPDRYDAAVEAAAYRASAEAIQDAVARRASVVTLHVRCDGGRLVVTAEDDGAAREAPLVHLADRVGALGGSLELGRRTLRAEIPCG